VRTLKQQQPPRRTQTPPNRTHAAPLPRREFRFYVTLFPKCFSNVRSRYLSAIGLPALYLALADAYLPLDAALPSSATRQCGGAPCRSSCLALRGYHPLRPTARRIRSRHGNRRALQCESRQITRHCASPPNAPHCAFEKDTSAPSSVPVRSPLTAGVTVVFLSSAD
jgi:hypothetical protein